MGDDHPPVSVNYVNDKENSSGFDLTLNPELSSET